MASYPWIVPHAPQRKGMSQFPFLATQQAFEIAKSINTAPTVDQSARSIRFGQDAKAVF